MVFKVSEWFALARLVLVFIVETHPGFGKDFFA